MHITISTFFTDDLGSLAIRIIFCGTIGFKVASSMYMNHRYDKLDPEVRPYAMMTRTAYMEYNPMKNRGKLPEIYARVVGQYIGDTVFLQDINENQIQVAVRKKNNSEIYFTDGWSRLRDFYGINAGAWITLLFISPFVFFIRVRYITGMEITYPFKTPPYRLMLEKPFQEATSSGHIPYFVLPKVFSHRLEKTLTAPDVETGTLVCLFSFPTR
ncbi:unnamed protein product [Trifolium pratense]|uniref:Uncharacterized protein n=1 Tax=Trifolium pratense TaxID=57577 RepID=A0ACB0JT70_TRIPR|nr:unnamed protein product [Trifolium pratense]